MKKAIISISQKFKIEFYDVDSMQVVWHGNYIKFMERARCALLDKIGFGYKEMVKNGFTFPITTVDVKYIHSLYFDEEAEIKAGLAEYENRIKIYYEIYNSKGVLCTKAETTQMAFDVAKNESMFVCPSVFIQKVKDIIKLNEEN